MFMHSFVVSDRNGLLRGRNSEVFWLLSGVQIPMMRDTLPSGKAEFLSGRSKLVHELNGVKKWQPQHDKNGVSEVKCKE